MNHRPSQSKTPVDDSTSPRAAKPSSLVITFLLVAAVGFTLELIVMRLNDLPLAVLGRNLSDFLDAGFAALVIAPLGAALAISRHRASEIRFDQCFHGWRGRGVAAIVLVAGLSLSGFAAWIAERQAHKSDVEHLNHLSDRFGDEVNRHMHMFQRGLRGARALWASSKLVERHEFKDMFYSRDLRQEFRGALAMGYAPRVQADEVETFLESTRTDDSASYALCQSPGVSELWPVTFFETVDEHLQLTGLDLRALDPVRNACELSVWTGLPQLTEPLTFSNDPKQRLLVVWVLPTFKKQVPLETPGNRLDAVTGWVFMPVDVAQAVGNLTEDFGNEVAIEIYHGTKLVSNKLIFDSNRVLSGTKEFTEHVVVQHNGQLHKHMRLEISNQRWTMLMQTTPHFQTAGRELVWALGGGGAIMSLLASLLILTLSNTANRARVIADAATADLRRQTAELERLALVVRETRNLVVITDAQRCIVWANQAFERLTGYSLEEVRGKVPGDLLQFDKTDPATIAEIGEALGNGKPCRVEILNRGKCGNEYWLDVEIQPLAIDPATGKPSGFIAVQSDITARKHAELVARHRTEQLQRANLELQSQRNLVEMQGREMRTLLDGLPGYAYLKNAQGVYLAANQTMCNALNLPMDQIVGRTDWHLFPAEAAARYRDDDRRALAGQIGATDTEYEISRDGTQRWILTRRLPLKAADGSVDRLIGLVFDITDRKLMEEELRQAARSDKLTGLPNRATVLEQVQLAIHRARRVSGYHFAVMFIDFDRFKMINDSLGHEMGDALLCQIAQRLQSSLRENDIIGTDNSRSIAARMGGDEFVILLDGLVDPGDAELVAARLLRVLSQSYQLGDQEVFSTASIGLVTSELAYQLAADMLRDADTAMYEAKAAGRGRYVLFGPSMRQRVQDRLMLENDLRQAIANEQLFIQYQPIVSLNTGQIASLEALLRWQHPTRGMVPPTEFVPIAEETGLIITIGEWVLRQACAQWRLWQHAMGSNAPASISVNVARKQLMVPDFPHMVRRVIHETKIPPHALHLEITESEIMQDAQSAVVVLRTLMDIGVKISMDDFGTGYSSLGCLRQFPISTLKIDRSFIANIGQGRDLAALVHAVTQLARNLNISVVAEGIENADQLAVLQSLDCDFGQGYLFAKPLNADDVPTYQVNPESWATQLHRPPSIAS